MVDRITLMKLKNLVDDLKFIDAVETLNIAQFQSRLSMFVHF